MSEIQRVKIGDNLIVNLSHIIEVVRDSRTGEVSITLTDSIGDDGNFPTHLKGDEATAFWEFYSNMAFGCADLTLLLPRKNDP